MTTNDEILILANQIANKGHTPTVALIKSKLSKKVTLPLIISTLKTWQHDPSFITLPESNKTNTDNTTEKRSTTRSNFEIEVTNELANIRKELVSLKALIEQLANQKQQS